MSVSAAVRGSVKPPSLDPRRVQRIDVVIVAALILAATGSAIGVMTYQDGRGGEFSIITRGITETIEAAPIEITGNSEGELVIDIPLRNITLGLVRVTIEATLVRTAATEFLVQLTVPGLNETFSAEGTIPAGPPTAITIDVPVEGLPPLPQASSVRAMSPEAALAQLDAEHGSDVGAGQWLVLVSAASGAPGPLASEPYAVSATAEIGVYSMTVAFDTPEGPR